MREGQKQASLQHIEGTITTVKLQIQIGETECFMYLSILFVREEFVIHPLKLNSGVMYTFQELLT